MVTVCIDGPMVINFKECSIWEYVVDYNRTIVESGRIWNNDLWRWIKIYRTVETQ